MAAILVVDDDLSLRTVVGRALERAGHSVALAANGFEGARYCRGREVDIAIIDIHMPGMDGIELLVQLRARSPTLPIVVMSGGDQTRQLALLEDARLLGATALLAKPFSLDELGLAVRRVLTGEPDAPTA